MLATQKSIHETKAPRLTTEAVVQVSGYFYAVTLAPGDHSIHRVGKDRRCTCSLGPDCPAVTAVAAYLRAGGERAPEPPSGFFPVVPHACPICGGETYFVPDLGSKHRGVGWACRTGSESHYWLAQVNAFRQHVTDNPWIYPPVYGKDGQVLYPGLRRDDVMTESKPWPDGYDPKA